MKLYRALLRLYPASFRQDYAPELVRTFEELVRDRGRVAATFAAIADVVPNAIAAHAELLRQDLAYAFRSFRNAPGFATTAILVVALGVGANTAAFSLAHFVFFKPFPYPQSDALVKLYEGDIQSEGDYGDMSPGNFRDWQPRQRSFSAVGVYSFRPANLVSRAEPRRVEIVRTTSQVLPLLGVSPIVGRTFSPEDTLTGQALVLSYALWQSQFGGDPSIVGTFVTLDGVPHAVVGVMPPSFQFPNQGIDGWAPFTATPDDLADRTNRYVFGIGRLKPGVSRAQARDDLNRIYADLEQQYPLDNHRTRAVVFTLRGEMSDRARTLIVALCGAALCILLLSCANLASLFLIRGAHRARELAVRAALGAGRERLVRQLITESLTLAALGGVVGIALASASIPLLVRLIPGGLPVFAQPSLDGRVLAMALAFVLIAGLAFGITPAIQGSRSSALDALRSGARAGGGRTQRIRSGLVILEVAASVVLLVSSGLLVRAVWRVHSVDPGFTAQNVLTVRTALPMPKYDSTARRVQFYDRVLEEVRALPGVQSAGYVTGLPLVRRGGIRSVTVPGREVVRDGSERVSYRFITSQYFAALGIPLLRGRDFTVADRRDAEAVAIVSESFGRQHWPGEDPLGKRFTISDELRTIVGVVGEVRVRGLEQESEPQVYVPAAQVADGATLGYAPQELVVRSSQPSSALVPRIREIVRAADPEQPVSHIRPLADIVADETAPRLTQLRVLGILTAIALLIAGVGIHGILSFAVSTRSKELGVRRALGAQVGAIVGLVVREGIVLAMVGVAIGIAVAYNAARGMTALLAGVRPEDPLTITVAAALCLVTALVGAFRPALRAARVDPLTALRAE